VGNKQLPYVLGAVALVVISLLVAYLEFGPKPAAEEMRLTDEAKAYITKLGLADIGMQVKLDYFQQKVLEITGTIANGGNRGLDVVEVYCVFRDGADNELRRERTAIVSKKMGGLQPGETKSFRLPFDSVPDTWNQQLPQLVIAGIDFQ
jgi:hypothetical protein